MVRASPSVVVWLPSCVGAQRSRLALMDRAAGECLKDGKEVIVMTPEEFEAYSDAPGTAIRMARQEGRVLHDRGD